MTKVNACFSTVVLVAACGAIDFGNIIDYSCPRIFQGDPRDAGATDWCATTSENEDMGGSCSGYGKVYYGYLLRWTYLEVDVSELDQCNDATFGCNPVPGAPTKYCFS